MNHTAHGLHGSITMQISLLGGVLVSMTNLLSPDCLLFSGGMSAQTELFVNPLIEYIKEHSYSVPEYMGLAALGEDAPMVGAALLSQEINARTPKTSASVMCADMLALAINPSTPIECMRELLPDIKMLLIMTVNPGYAGQKIVAQSFDKIKRTRKYLDDLGYSNIMIEVDGNCSFENVPKMYAAGAEIFVVGSSSVFALENGIVENTKRLYSLIGE